MFEGARVQQTDYQFKRAMFLSKSELEVPIFGQIQLVPSHVFIQVWAPYGPEIPLRSGQLHFEGRPGGKHPSPGAPRAAGRPGPVGSDVFTDLLETWRMNKKSGKYAY